MNRYRLVGGAAALVASFAIATYVLGQAPDWSVLVLTLALAAAAMMLTVLPLALPRGGVLGMDAGIATCAIMLLPPGLAVSTVVWGAGFALAVGAAGGRRVDGSALFRRTLGVLSAIAVYGLLSGESVRGSGDDWTWLLLGAVSGLVYTAVDLAGFILPRHNRASGSSGVVAFATLVRLLGGLYLGQISLGLVLATVYSVLGLLALPILVVLMLLMQHSFALLLRIRESYVRTVTALAHLPEMQSNRKGGHSERVSELSVLVGRQVGLSGRKLERLALAALLHDIGRIAVDGFDSQQRHDEDSAAVSEGGARILDKIAFLAEVAPVLRAQSHRTDNDENSTMGAIISMCSDWDEFSSAGLSLEGALGEMRVRWPDSHHLRCRSALERVVLDPEYATWC